MTLPAPLTPPQADLRHLKAMMLEIGRLRGSAFDAMADDGAWRAGVNLWLSAFHQVPAGSLPDDDAELVKAAQLGRDVRTWKRLKASAMRGWIKCADGRFYHSVVAETVLDAWLSSLLQQLSSGAGNARRWGAAFDEAVIRAEIVEAAVLLRNLDSKHPALRKKPVVQALAGIPLGCDRDPSGTADGMPDASRRDPNRRERKGRVSKGDPDGSTLTDDARGRAPGGAPPAVWTGPDAVWTAVVDKHGEDWARRWLAPCDWRDVPARTVVTPDAATDAELRRTCTRLLERLNVVIEGRAAA